MKKLALGLAVLSSTFVYSQVNTNGDVSGDVGTPTKINWSGNKGGVDLSFVKDSAGFLINRFHTLDIGAAAYDMEAEGVSERSFVSVFTAKGALVYHHELLGGSASTRRDIETIVGKNAGAQILPYTISLTDDGRRFVSVSAYSLKNMNSAVGRLINLEYGRRTISKEPYGVIDDLSFLTLEYDDNFTNSNIESLKLKIVSIDAKLSLLASSKPGTFLAVTAGGDLGLHQTEYQNGSEVIKLSHMSHERENKREREEGYDFTKLESGNTMGFEAGLRYGLQLNHSTSNGWRIEAKALAENRLSYGQHYTDEAIQSYNDAVQGNLDNKTAYRVALSEFQERKLSYQSAHTNGVDISDESYQNLTNDKIPTPAAVVKPEANEINTVRNQFFMVPSLNISKRLNKNGNAPIRMGMRVYGNIPLGDGDQVKELNLNLNDSRQKMGASLYINF